MLRVEKAFHNLFRLELLLTVCETEEELANSDEACHLGTVPVPRFVRKRSSIKVPREQCNCGDNSRQLRRWNNRTTIFRGH
jgi:hypothetical protein